MSIPSAKLAIDLLREHPYFTPEVRAATKLSVLGYLKARVGVMPTWFSSAKVIVLAQPSSAAAERVFSLLESFFGKRGTRGRALADVINSTLKLRFNDRDV